MLAPFWTTFPSFLHNFFEHESLMIFWWFLDELLMDFWWEIPQKTLYFPGKTNIFIKSPFRKQTQKIIIFGPMSASCLTILASNFITFSASIFSSNFYQIIDQKWSQNGPQKCLCPPPWSTPGTSKNLIFTV